MSFKHVYVFVGLLKDYWSDCPKHFSEIVEAPECLSSMYIFLLDLKKTPGVPGAPKYFLKL